MKGQNGFGVAALVCGIISLISIFAPYFGLPLAVLALVFANKQKKIEPNGIATAGNVTGIIGIVINAIMLFIVMMVLLFAASMS